MTRYKIAVLFILLGLCSTGNAHSWRMEEKNTLFSAKIVFPTSFDPQSFPLRIYYGGDILETEVIRNTLLFSVDKALYQLTRPDALRTTPVEFYVLFTKKTAPVFMWSEDMDHLPILSHYTLPDDTPYKCFKITLSEETDSATGKHWQIAPHTIKNDIPLNTFTVILDPSLVTNLQEERWRPGSNSVKLPSIMLVEDADRITASCEQAALLAINALHSDTYHGRTQEARKEHCRIGTIQIALCDNNPLRSH